MAKAQGEKLELRYVPLAQVVKWDRNPKKHDYGKITDSIKKHGFRDPMAYDAKLNGGKGGIVEGNGRSVVLNDLWMNSEKPPRGIVQNGKGWLVPVLFGIDAKSQKAAEAYALDHNSITLLGGDFGIDDLAKLYDEGAYNALLNDLQDANIALASLSYDDLEKISNPDVQFKEYDETIADGIKVCKCQKCGHEHAAKKVS